MPAPVTFPRWATNLTNNDTPSSGQQDTGWTPGQDGVSDYDNWVKYWTYQWLLWLSTNGGDFYGERDFGIMAKSFIPADPSTFNYGTNSSADGSWMTMALNDVLLHDLQVEAGDTITKLEFSLNAIATNIDFDYKLRRRQIGTSGTGFADVTTGTITVTGGTTVLKELLPAHVVAAGYSYQLYVKLTVDAFTSGGKFYGASVYRKRV